MTLGDFYDCLDGHKKRIKEQLELQNILNWELGQYVAMGVHATEKNPYPNKPLEFTKKANEASGGSGFTTDSELDAYFTTMAKNNQRRK